MFSEKGPVIRISHRIDRFHAVRIVTDDQDPRFQRWKSALADIQRGHKGTAEAEKKAAFQSVVQKAEQGDAEAQYKLGGMYREGTDYVDEDGQKAVFWFKKAAAQGDTDAMSSLGTIYRNGLSGFKKDDKEADFWFEKRRKTIEAQQKKAQGAFQTNGSIAGDKVNVRTAPNMSAKVVKQLNTGHPVNVGQKNGDWYFIQTASGTKGWVFGKYVKFK